MSKWDGSLAKGLSLRPKPLCRQTAKVVRNFKQFHWTTLLMYHATAILPYHKTKFSDTQEISVIILKFE